MELRDRRDDDLGELVAVAARVHAVDRYPLYLPDGGFERFLTRPEPLEAWVAVREEVVVGHVALNRETSAPVMRLAEDLEPGPVAFVARLLVDPGARRQRIGARLLDRASRAAIGLGLVPMLDVVDTPTASSAIALYRSEGWEEVGRTRFSLPEVDDLQELVFRGPTD